MKRMALIAIVLCALMLGTLGAGVVTAKQDNALPAGAKQFDVTLDGKVVGKLIVNTKQLTYSFNGHGLDPGATYYLTCSAFTKGISSAVASDAGTVRMEGTCEQWLGVLAANPTFKVSTDAPPVGESFNFYPVLHAHWSKTVFATWKVWGRLTDGKVTDGVTERGIPGAIIWIDTWDKDGHYVNRGYATTDGDGNFKFSKAANILRDPDTHPPLVDFPGMLGGKYYDMWTEQWYDMYWFHTVAYATPG